MPKPLADLIAEKLELEPEKIEHMLSDYVRKLERSIRADGANHIEGFGVFEWRDARVQFTPDEALSRLVNYRYQSLSALSGPSRADQPSEVLADDVSDGAAEALADDAAEDTVEAVILSPSAPRLDSDTETKSTHEPVEAAEGVWEAAIFADSGKPDEVGVDRPEAATSSRKAIITQPASNLSSRMPYIVLPLLMIVIAATAYFLLDGGLLRPTGDVPSQSQVDTPGDRAETGQAQTTQAQDTPDDDPEEGSENGPNEAVAKEDPEPRNIAATPSPAPPADIAGEFVSIFTRQTSGYTLVVGRSSSHLDADNRIRRYSSLGLPLAILEYEDNGITYFRLLVGRYDTIDDAQQTMQNLGSQLPGGTWIRRIRLLFPN